MAKRYGTWEGVRERVWRLRHTGFWSGKRSGESLRKTVLNPDYEPITWRRLMSRPGWCIAFIRYEKR